MTPGLFARPARLVPGDPRLRARDERLESLKAVAGKLAHDFNNFLVPQFGYLTLLKEELPPGTTASEYAARMEAAGRKTESYVESILLGMRPHRQFSPAEFSLSGLLESALAQWMKEIPPATAIELQQQIDPAVLCGDERQWKSALFHLLANARYALATGGRLTVTLTQSALSPSELERLGLNSSPVFQITIQDDGFGMSPEVAERAFEPFFTTRTRIKAAGLGLTIVHAVTQFHGGQVDLRTSEDLGTTVTLWIPVDGGMSRANLFGRTSSKPTPEQKRKVLLVEEDPLINEVLRDWLGRFDFDVQVATTREQALKLFERKQAEWSLVIIDTDLPGSSAEELHSQLLPLNPALPWLFLAGKRKPGFPPELMASATTPLVLQKPVTLRALVNVVQDHSRLSP